MGNQKCALWESLEHCVSSLWVCLLPFKSRTFGTVCIDKTHECLSRAIYHLTPLAPSSYTKAIFTHISHSLSVVYTQLCTQIYLECQQCDFICFHPIPLSVLSLHLYIFSLWSSVGGGGVSNPIGKWRIRCRCSVSFSAQLSASLMSAWPLWSCPLMFWGTYHVTSNSLSKYAPFYLNSSAIKAVPARPLILLLLVFSLSVISLLSVSAGLSSQG